MADYSYPDTQLFLNGEWKPAAAGETIAVTDPATGEVIGQVAKAGIVDLDTALAATQAGFAAWSATSAYDRARIMRKAADIQFTYVPFQSAQAGMQAVINGDVDLFCADVGVILGFLGSDKVSPLAVAGASRSEYLPNTPTLAESGISGVLSANRFALFLPIAHELPTGDVERLRLVIAQRPEDA